MIIKPITHPSHSLGSVEASSIPSSSSNNNRVPYSPSKHPPSRAVVASLPGDERKSPFSSSSSSSSPSSSSPSSHPPQDPTRSISTSTSSCGTQTDVPIVSSNHSATQTNNSLMLANAPLSLTQEVPDVVL